jgi:hypothetical protein
MTTDQKTHIASLTAVVVHLSGAIGMIASGYADWFVSMTPYNLLFMLA